MEERLPRKLAVILHADVAGYSRLAGANEDATHRRLSASRELVTELTESHHGQVVNTAGDAVLAMFDAVADALTCAISIQRELGKQNSGESDDNKLLFRIGINLGDVIVDKGDIFGDGVNVAARLEGLAESGGICISGPVYDAVSTSLKNEFSAQEGVTFKALGIQELKNIPEPVAVYNVIDREQAGSSDESGGYDVSFELPEKPSIVVLPFQNMSADSEQEFFADGLTEDIITRLSYLRDLFVISRTSAFAYKNRSLPVQEISGDLGVRYVLEGSVRKFGNQIRITAQLIDGSTGGHMWAETFDRELADVFAVQDEITFAIVKAMKVNLTEGEVARLEEGETHDLRAWEAFHQAVLEFLKYTRESNLQARALFGRALKYDPDYVDAKIYMAFTHCMDARSGYVADRSESMRSAYEIYDGIEPAGKETANAKNFEAFYNVLMGNFDQALAAADATVDHGPCRMFGFAPAAQVYMYCGKPRAALKLLKISMRLSPFLPSDVLYFIAYVSAWNGDYGHAIKAAEEYCRRIPGDIYAYVVKAIVYGMAGETESSASAVEELLSLFPNYTIKEFAAHEAYRDEADLDKVASILRAAGLPEDQM